MKSKSIGANYANLISELPRENLVNEEILALANFIFAATEVYYSPVFLFFGILLGIVISIIGLFVLYFIIKTAAKHALKEYHEEKEQKGERDKSNA